MHLHLIDAGQPVFDRVFDGDDLFLGGIEFGQRGIERRRFTAAGRAGDQHHAARAAHGMTQAFERTRRHIEAIKSEQTGVLVEQAHHDRFAVLRRHGRDTHVDHVVAHLDGKATILRQTLFGNIQARHQLQAQGQRRGNLGVGFHLHVQNAVDTEAHTQGSILRFDVDIGSPRTHRLFEYRLQQLDDGRFFGARRCSEQVAKLHRHIAQIFGQLLGQAGDFLGTPIHPVDQRQQLAFSHHGDLDFPPHQPSNIVVGLQIGGIDKADLQASIDFVQYNGAETPCLRLGQQVDQVLLGIEMLEVDKGNLQLPGERLRNCFFRNKGTFDDNTPQLATATLLLFERKLELLIGEQSLLNQQIAKANLFRPSHCKLQ